MFDFSRNPTYGAIDLIPPGNESGAPSVTKWFSMFRYYRHRGLHPVEAYLHPLGPIVVSIQSIIVTRPFCRRFVSTVIRHPSFLPLLCLVCARRFARRFATMPPPDDLPDDLLRRFATTIPACGPDDVCMCVVLVRHVFDTPPGHQLVVIRRLS